MREETDKFRYTKATPRNFKFGSAATWNYLSRFQPLEKVAAENDNQFAKTFANRLR